MGAWFLTSIVPLTGGEYTPIQSLEEGLSTFSHVTVTQSPDWTSSVVLTWRVMVVSAEVTGIYTKVAASFLGPHPAIRYLEYENSKKNGRTR